MIHLMLVEAALELVPPQIAGHPAVIANALKRGKRAVETLLDVSVHKAAMGKLPKRHKRGRPDIVHRFLLLAQDSPLNKENMLRVHIHTLNGLYIRVAPEMRPPRDYRRFVGLMEQLLMRGSVPPERPLMTSSQMSLRSVVEEINPACVLLLREGGKAGLAELVEKATSCDNPLIMVGGFQRGDFEEETLRLADETFSIYRKPLTTSTIVSRVLCMIEAKLVFRCM